MEIAFGQEGKILQKIKRMHKTFWKGYAIIGTSQRERVSAM
jgi:hypothetical protein